MYINIHTKWYTISWVFLEVEWGQKQGNGLLAASYNFLSLEQVPLIFGFAMRRYHVGTSEQLNCHCSHLSSAACQRNPQGDLGKAFRS